jgi:peptidoglycan/xylan/chitin deacetylase (PgdA/CDA1 family)
VVVLAARAAGAAEVAGAEVALDQYEGPAQVSVTAVERLCLRVDLDPKGEQRPLTIRVDLAQSGPATWTVEDVQVTDATGKLIPVRRSGTEWGRLFIATPPTAQTYFVEAVIPPPGRLNPPSFPETDRDVIEAGAGLRARVCEWFDGRRAALSLRFDDSHPTHTLKAIPILREYGFRGTFMINPGTPDYEEHREAWEACAAQGDQEFANHTMHHRGVLSDEELEAEVGAAAEYIRGLFPGRSGLLALNRGGGTTWVTETPFRQCLEKHLLFVVEGSLGMDDTYGERVQAFRTHLERHLERGLWCRAHFHYIGDGLSTTEANFRAALNVVREHAGELWIAGMADIYKYQTERRATKLALRSTAPDGVTLTVSCATDPSLFDQPLTIEATLPAAAPAPGLTVAEDGAEGIAARAVPGSEGKVWRFDVGPADGAYTLALER